jgi:tetratricopeptide (TPR) repeat protein
MPTKAEQTFTQALALHQRGQLGEAERLYRQVLKQHPDNLDALNLLGVLALQTGRNEEAIDLIGRALARNDRVADFHNNIAEAYRRSGRLDAAAAHFAKAAELPIARPSRSNPTALRSTAISASRCRRKVSCMRRRQHSRTPRRSNRISPTRTAISPLPCSTKGS